MKLAFPDSCWNPGVISGALLLYFHSEKIGLTLHPSVSTFMTGIDPFEFIRLVEQRRPEWSGQFAAFFHHWKAYQTSLRATGSLLEPLRGTAFTTLWVSYPRGADAWEFAKDLISSSTLNRSEIAPLIDPFSASDELFAHIFFNRYLELYHPEKTQDQLVAMGKDLASQGRPTPVNIDWTALYSYCNELFHNASVEELLTTAYMFRMRMLNAWPAVLLTNPNLVPLLASLPLQAKQRPDAAASSIDLDVIAWEFFRQIVSPHVDPITTESVQRIQDLTEKRSSEIDALRKRCLTLAEDFGAETSLNALQKRIAQHIRLHVEAEVQAVLSLDKKALQEFFDSVFSDEKAWAGIAAFLMSFLQGGAVLTAGAAVYALSNLGSKAVKAAAARREKVNVSDYALLYRIKQ